MADPLTMASTQSNQAKEVVPPECLGDISVEFEPLQVVGS